jgi:hypothetical protein
LASGHDQFGQEQLWQALNRELERHRAYENGLARAEEWRLKEQYEKAEKLLRQMAAQEPPDQRASLLLRTVTTERSINEREQAARRGVPKPVLVRYRWLAAVAAVLLISVVAILTKVTHHPTFHIEPDPPGLSFTYRIGDAPPAPQRIDLKNSGLPFTPSPSVPWLVVTPEKGGRLQVGIRTAGLQAGPTDGTITIAPKTAANVTGTRTVPVHLEVKPETRVPTGSRPPGQETLIVYPKSLDFLTYQAGGTPPGPQEIHVLQGRIMSFPVDPDGQRWLKARRKGSGIAASVQPKGLPEANYSTALMLKSSSGEEFRVPVTLSVKATPTAPTATVTSPAAPPPALNPCIPPEKYTGVLEGDITWSGELPPGEEHLLARDGKPGLIMGGDKFPVVCAKRIDVVPNEVELTQVRNTNQWKVRNRSGQTLFGFRIHWRAE